jgi:hypothetical protein
LTVESEGAKREMLDKAKDKREQMNMTFYDTHHDMGVQAYVKEVEELDICPHQRPC